MKLNTNKQNENMGEVGEGCKCDQNTVHEILKKLIKKSVIYFENFQRT